ncbi:MAG: hypothetical protein ACR2GY_06555 [Phycisphaerales bacterium]
MLESFCVRIMQRRGPTILRTVVASALLSVGFGVSSAVAMQDSFSQPAADPQAELVQSLRSKGMAGLRSLWTTLGITTDIFKDLDDTASITVTVNTFQVDGKGDNDTLLCMSDEAQVHMHLLVLSRNGDAWSSLGVINLWNQRATAPTLRMEVSGNDDRWLVVRSVGGSGAGFERVDETWYQQSGSAFTSVLSYPIAGSVEGHGLPFDRRFTGTLMGLKGEESSPHVDVQLTATYTCGSGIEVEGCDLLFERREAVRYTRASSSSPFQIDEANSGFSAVEVAGLFADDEQGFLQHNFESLKSMAVNGDAPRRTWLKLFLDRQSESTEKAAIVAILNAADSTAVEQSTLP